MIINDNNYNKYYHFILFNFISFPYIPKLEKSLNTGTGKNSLLIAL